MEGVPPGGGDVVVVSSPTFGHTGVPSQLDSHGASGLPGASTSSSSAACSATSIANNLSTATISLASTAASEGDLRHSKVDLRNELTDRNLFIFHLPTSWDEADLKRAFEPYGKVLSCKVIRRLETNTSKGYGFVCMESHEAAVRAIDHMNGAEVAKGKRLKVSLKKTPTECTTQVVNRLLALSNGDNRHYDREKDCTLFIFHLPWDWTNETLRKEFAKFGKVLSAKVTLKPDRTSRGYGFVTLSLPSEAAAAISQMNGLEIGGKRLKVKLKESAPKGDVAPGCTIYVGQIPASWTEDELKQHFLHCGKIISCVIKRDSSYSSSSPFGFVSFSSPRFAVNAVNAMNGFVVEHKRLRVSIRRGEEWFADVGSRQPQPQPVAGPPMNMANPLGPPSMANVLAALTNPAGLVQLLDVLRGTNPALSQMMVGHMAANPQTNAAASPAAQQAGLLQQVPGVVQGLAAASSADALQHQLGWNLLQHSTATTADAATYGARTQATTAAAEPLGAWMASMQQHQGLAASASGDLTRARSAAEVSSATPPSAVPTAANSALWNQGGAYDSYVAAYAAQLAAAAFGGMRNPLGSPTGASAQSSPTASTTATSNDSYSPRKSLAATAEASQEAQLTEVDAAFATRNASRRFHPYRH